MARHVFSYLRWVVAYDDYFICKEDALGRGWLLLLAEMHCSYSVLAYKIPCDLIDEYVRMSESTCLESMYRFCKAV